MGRIKKSSVIIKANEKTFGLIFSSTEHKGLVHLDPYLSTNSTSSIADDLKKGKWLLTLCLYNENQFGEIEFDSFHKAYLEARKWVLGKNYQNLREPDPEPTF